MKRIEPVEIKTAYEKTGLRPIQGGWSKPGCGCGLTAYAVANGLVSREQIEAIPECVDDEDEILTPLLSILDTNYISGFVDGFDGDRMPSGVYRGAAKEAYRVGLSDGEAAAALVFPEAQ